MFPPMSNTIAWRHSKVAYVLAQMEKLIDIRLDFARAELLNSSILQEMAKTVCLPKLRHLESSYLDCMSKDLAHFLHSHMQTISTCSLADVAFHDSRESEINQNVCFILEQFSSTPIMRSFPGVALPGWAM